MQPLTDPPASSPYSTRLWLGIAVIIFGILMALDNLPFSHDHLFLRLWPVILIVVGIGKVSRPQVEKGISGWVFVLAGAFLLLHYFGSDNLTDALGPLFIVALGVFLVTKALRKGRGVPPELAAHDSFISSTAIFSGSKRRVTQQDFKGGELTAIFGGFELDLRQATLEGNQVRVDVFVLFGGGELKIPQDWAVTMKGSAIMGGFEDKTLHMPSAEPLGPRIHLVVTGLILFGGLTVMN
jgi:predicted membrane protein